MSTYPVDIKAKRIISNYQLIKNVFGTGAPGRFLGLFCKLHSRWSRCNYSYFRRQWFSCNSSEFGTPDGQLQTNAFGYTQCIQFPGTGIKSKYYNFNG